VGQPNSGKSTLFNAIVGYRAVASNFPGTTVEVLRGRALIGGRPAEVYDLPGTYSLSGGDRAEQVARDFLLSGRVDVVVNVVDASLLGRSLELTLELSELGLPMVLCLNMVDEAKRKGIDIDPEALSRALGIPVVETVAVRGIGLSRLLTTIREARSPEPPRCSADVEEILGRLEERVRELGVRTEFPPRYAAILLLSGFPPPPGVSFPGELVRLARELGEELRRRRGEDPALILAAERHALALRLFEEVARLGRPRIGIRDRLDAVLMHPFWGYLFLAGVLYGLFWVVFRVGGILEEFLIPPLEGLTDSLQGLVPGVGGSILVGAFQGLWAGVAIVLPYLVPFLFLLALLEDVGYLPRIGFLMDSLMHRIGLHGKSVIPFLLGYGCSVPAVLATRILEDERDRLVTAALAVMIPCAGRAIVIFGLVGRFVGPTLAFGLYLLNLAVIAIAGVALRRFLPGTGPGLILEIPPYRIPSPRTLLAKIWVRLRDFVVLAWPLLVGTSAAFSLIEALGWTAPLNSLLRVFTWPLGLPPQAGVPLIFGVLRKELSLIMLTQAFGTADLGAVLSHLQMLVFTVFVIFYIPCVATVAALGRELGWKRTFFVLLGTTGIAMGVSLIVRALGSL